MPRRIADLQIAIPGLHLLVNVPAAHSGHNAPNCDVLLPAFHDHDLHAQSFMQHMHARQEAVVTAVLGYSQDMKDQYEAAYYA